MKIIIFLLTLIIIDSSSAGSIEYSAHNYPNPTKDFGSCGRPTNSWICDPDSIIDPQTANEIHAILNYIHQKVPSGCEAGGYQVAVALMSKFHVPSATTAEEQAKKMAKELHDLWKVGHVNCNNGILFLLSKEDRKMYISTGSGAKYVLTDKLINDIIEKMKSGLRKGEFSETIKEAIIDIKHVLERNKPHQSIINIESIFLTSILGIAFLIIILIIHYYTERKKKDCKHKLSLIDRQAKAKKFTAIMCPICLEEFTNLPKKILDCGHSFCKPCITKWLKKKPYCPICRLKCFTPAPKTHDKELQFHLNSLSRIYPDYIPQKMVYTWTATGFDGNFSIYGGASDSFGGGISGVDCGDCGDCCSGGGGGGGSW